MHAPAWVQVPLLVAIKLLIFEREEQKGWGDYDTSGPCTFSYPLMDEYLFWVAVLHR
jgi:hypothetical protein